MVLRRITRSCYSNILIERSGDERSVSSKMALLTMMSAVVFGTPGFVRRETCL